DPEERPDARIRFRQGDRTVEGQSGLLCAVRARPRGLGDAPCRRGISGRGARRCAAGGSAARPPRRPARAGAKPAAGELAADGREGGGGAWAASPRLLPAGGGGAVPPAVDQGQGRRDLAVSERVRTGADLGAVGAGAWSSVGDRFGAGGLRGGA